MILLDTHVLIWAFENDRRLGREAVEIIDKSVSDDNCAFAAITVWEIAMLTERGRLALSCDVTEWVAAVLNSPGMRLLTLEPAIAIGSNRLPGHFHADPADRMIVATARHYDLPLLTADRAILAYAEAGHVRTVDASV